MDDGRFLTDYRTASTREEETKHKVHIQRNDDYRVYLQTNGINMINAQWKYERTHDACINNACAHQYPLRQNPKNFETERIQSGLLLTSVVLPASMTCKKYDDYRAYEE
jgi:hypothetical protein